MCDNVRECEAAKRQGFIGAPSEGGDEASSLRVRPARPGDSTAILAIHRDAFETDTEANLVEALLADGDAVISLVAVENSVVVGHALLSRLHIEGEAGEVEVLGLAPLAVRPQAQNRGIGSALVEASVVAAADAGWRAIVVLGHPDFYPRFGFTPAMPRGILPPWPEVPADAWMVAELAEGSLIGASGTVAYPRAFDDAV